jgi:hypothetical protein
LHAFQPAHRIITRWLAAIAGSVALLLATPAVGHAEESNPNNYICRGHVIAGQPELGSDEQQVKYTFDCNGPITGYQLQSQIPVTGVQSPPLVADSLGNPLTDTFSCSGEIPGFAVNCVGAAKGYYEQITGQFAIGTKLCAEPQVDPLLSVTYAYLEKGAVTQAISGPFDLGRPWGCPPDYFSGTSRFEPVVPKSHRQLGRRGHRKTTKKANRRTAGKKAGSRKR